MNKKANRINLTSTGEFCPRSKDKVHSYFDMSYWTGNNHPKCEWCGYEDKTREVNLK